MLSSTCGRIREQKLVFNNKQCRQKKKSFRKQVFGRHLLGSIDLSMRNVCVHGLYDRDKTFPSVEFPVK